MWKKIILSLSFLFLLGLIIYREVLLYGIRQANGQFRILWEAVPIEEKLNDASFPDSLKQKIHLIQEIKQFAVDSLGLSPSDSYTSYFEQNGKPILWVITACPTYSLEPQTWNFPLLGTFSYKGFFEEKLANEAIASLQKEQMDTRKSEVSAWSTLGYLNDPILSSMLTRSEASLASLIIHEMTHGTVFRKNDLAFNENLADFIGDYGAERYLVAKYGADNPLFKAYQQQLIDQERYAQHIQRGSRLLDSLYHAEDFKKRTDSQKKKQKEDYILQIVQTIDTLHIGGITPKRKIKQLPNNAYFAAFATYQSKQNEFEKEFKEKFKGDFRAYMTYLKNEYPRHRWW